MNELAVCSPELWELMVDGQEAPLHFRSAPWTSVQNLTPSCLEKHCGHSHTHISVQLFFLVEMDFLSFQEQNL